MNQIQEIQKILGVNPDGKWGPFTQAALDTILGKRVLHSVMASSFADPDDVAAFKKCKAEGHTDQFCFSKGDNGRGCWNDDTTVDTPMCALPPEHWQPLGRSARGALVRVVANGKEIVCELRDTMPYLKNIKNGAGIDLNPEAVKRLGLKPPIMIPATWNWV